MTDDRFERELRAFLATREPRTVSPVLRARLKAVTAEPPPGAGALGGRFREAWRVAVGVTVTAALAIVVLAILARTGGLTLTDRIPGPVGAPSAAPVVPTVPFVTAPTDFFSAGAMADADRRLAALFERSSIEGRFIVMAVPSADELSTPPGWPTRFKADRNDDADIAAVLGVTPGGVITCCITITGGLIERAREDHYWRPQSWPDRLEADLESSELAIRDAALDRFVDGLEALEPGVALTREAVAREATFSRVATTLIGLGLLVAFVLLTWSRWAASRARLSVGDGIVDGASIPAVAGPANLDADVPTVAEAHDPDVAPVAWASPGPHAQPRDQTLVAFAAAALGGLLALGVWDLIGPRAAGVPMDVTAPAAGLASPDLPVVPTALLASAVIALLLIARHARRRRRVAIATLLLVVGLAGWWAIDGSHPMPGSSWIAGLGAGAVDRGPGSIFDFQTYPLDPDEPFTLGMTIRNPGPLPMAILGLDGVQPTQPNPYVASIVGLGSIEQATVDGYVATLSARPEDARVAWPRTMGPGEELAIVLLGRAGPCAEPAGTGSGLPLLHVQLTYRVLGIERSETVGLPVALFVPEKATCTVDVPGGTVTYGEP
jgi:hypothetical protein